MTSLVPDVVPDEVHFVLCDLGRIGQAFAETDPARSGREHVVEDILSGELANPIRVVALHSDGTWRDVSSDVAWAVAKGVADPDALTIGARTFILTQLEHSVLS